VSDNHVINSQNVEETKQKAIYQKRWVSHDLASIVIGAESGDITKFTNEYSGLFKRAGVLPKNKISKFLVTEDALLPPGTPLFAQHFKIGQYVDVFGKSIDRGFEGVVRRWGFKGIIC
jgi:large subunit ribosomal protein L3